MNFSLISQLASDDFTVHRNYYKQNKQKWLSFFSNFCRQHVYEVSFLASLLFLDQYEVSWLVHTTFFDTKNGMIFLGF